MRSSLALLAALALGLQLPAVVAQTCPAGARLPARSLAARDLRRLPCSRWPLSPQAPPRTWSFSSINPVTVSFAAVKATAAETTTTTTRTRATRSSTPFRKATSWRRVRGRSPLCSFVKPSVHRQFAAPRSRVRSASLRRRVWRTGLQPGRDGRGVRERHQRRRAHRAARIHLRMRFMLSQCCHAHSADLDAESRRMEHPVLLAAPRPAHVHRPRRLQPVPSRRCGLPTMHPARRAGRLVTRPPARDLPQRTALRARSWSAACANPASRARSTQ